jgi:CubicO group peptidase (beta-lactamase class C family)
VNAEPLANIAVLVGDETGVLFRHEKGAMKTDRTVLIASASKLVFAVTAWTLVERGELSRTSRPQDHIAFWTSVSGDGRSAVTLDQLLSFRSGFNISTPPSCVGSSAFTLSACVQQVYNQGLDTLPGAVYYYGSEHMQIAALMISNLRGKSVDAVMRELIFDPLGISAATQYPPGLGDNAIYAGSMRSNGEDYAKLLTAILKGDVIRDRAGFLEDRTNGILMFRPPGIEANGLDWHYGFGFWKECDVRPYAPACDAAPVISSPGAFGFTPWIDFDNRYWGIVVIEEISAGTGSETGPATISVGLEQQLQPLIETALGR